MNNSCHLFIFTCNPQYIKLTLYEFGRYDPSFQLVKWLEDGIGLGETGLNITDLYECIIKSPIIFVRHIFEVQKTFSIKTDAEDLSSLCIEEVLSMDALPDDRTFCVQLRNSRKMYTEEAGQDSMSAVIAAALEQKGYKLDIYNGEMIVSIYAAEAEAYMGINEAVYNLSHFKGGMPHYASTKDYDFVSRAEFKLLEAITSFNINLSDMTNAADLGAAPGGWTKVLVDAGLNCVSIDPGYLDKKIVKNPRVSYYHMMVEEYLKQEHNEVFDLVVNDMKMDVGKSVAIINKFYPKIRDRGYVIITFKLKNGFSYKTDILDPIKKLNGFELIGARQLFHNRSEITVVLRKTTSSGCHDIKNINSTRKSNKPKQKKSNERGNLSKKLERKYKNK